MREENRSVHGLWIGELTRLELLAIHSFAARGHDFHLWRYEETTERLPRNVVIRDANEILPYEDVFRKGERDSDSGLGEGSYATFSDLFRARLLYELGGIWVDMDVVCLRPFGFEAPYVFRGHRAGAVMNLIKCPPRSDLMAMLLESSERPHADSTWLGFTRSFYDSIVRNGLEDFIRYDLLPRGGRSNPSSRATHNPTASGTVFTCSTSSGTNCGVPVVFTKERRLQLVFRTRIIRGPGRGSFNGIKSTAFSAGYGLRLPRLRI
jgi:hypothetical protein